MAAASSSALIRSELVRSSAERISIPEESRFQFLDYFWSFSGIGTGIGAKMNRKGIVFSDSQFHISEIGKGNLDSRFLILRNHLSTITNMLLADDKNCRWYKL